MTTFRAYVDDFGDPGTGGRGTPFFGWCAFVAADASVARFEELRRDLSPLRSQRQPGQWHCINWDSRDVLCALEGLAAEPDWWWMAVVSDTTTATPATSTYIHKPHLHRLFTIQWLLHRVSWFADERKATVSACIDDPGRRLSLTTLQQEWPGWNAGGRGAALKAMPASSLSFSTGQQTPLLELADLLAHAMHDAVNPNDRWSRVFEDGVRSVRDRVWYGPVWRQLSMTLYGVMPLPYGQPTNSIARFPFLQEWVAHFGLAS